MDCDKQVARASASVALLCRLQWDQAYAVPKEVRSMSLFTGDILALAATDKAVFTAGADGSLRRWALGKLGELSEAEVRDKAHDGRITALAVSGSLLFSAGYDGDIKVSTAIRHKGEGHALCRGYTTSAWVAGMIPCSLMEWWLSPPGSLWLAEMCVAHLAMRV